MRKNWFGIGALLAGVVSYGGCASSSPAPSGGGACGSVAACYQGTVTLESGAPAACADPTTGATSLSRVYNYEALTSDGPVGAKGCTGTYSKCSLDLTCPDGSVAHLTFTGSGFNGTIADGQCKGTISGARLAACPGSSDGGTEAGQDAAPAACTVSSGCPSGCCEAGACVVKDGVHKCACVSEVDCPGAACGKDPGASLGICAVG